MAGMVGASTGQVGKIESILKNGSKDLKKAVRSGEITIAAAHKLSGLTEEQQDSILRQNVDPKITASEVEKKIRFTDGHQRKRILKCAHHGSKYSSSEEFIEGYDPDIAVISCGKNNMYGHPAPETLERLKEEGSFIYRTDLDGAVIIEY